MALNENVGGGASLSDGLYMVAESHGMVMDELTRQSPALSSLNHTSSVIVMHPNTAKSAHVALNDWVKLSINAQKISAQIRLDDHMPEQLVAGHLSPEALSKVGTGVMLVSRMEVVNDPA